MQGAQVQSLVRELDLSCHMKTQHNQIFKKESKHLDPPINLQEIQKTEKNVKLSFRYAVSKIQTVRNCRTDNSVSSFNKFQIKIAIGKPVKDILIS